LHGICNQEKVHQAESAIRYAEGMNVHRVLMSGQALSFRQCKTIHPTNTCLL